MATVASIDALPLELLRTITASLAREDILKLRLVAPRSILPYINALVFENLIVDIDATDDLPRWVYAEEDGVAVKRIQEVAASRISDHVRVLTLRLTRPYSLSGYYEKLGVKKYPTGYVPAPVKPALYKRISSFFLPVRPNTPEEIPTVTEVPAPKPRRKVDYAAELATALQALFKATDLVRTIRLIQPDGFNSQYDIVYPSVYGRVLVRLITALESVNIPENATLELLDCPTTHLEESGLSLDVEVISTVASKFSKIALCTRGMGYAMIKPGTTNLKNKPYDGRKGSGLGAQLIKGLSKNPLYMDSLKIWCAQYDHTILQPFIEVKQEWRILRHLELHRFTVDAQSFSDFASKIIAHLQSLILLHGSLIQKVGAATAGWRSIYDKWIAIKESQSPDQWSLRTLKLEGLMDGNNHYDVSHIDTKDVVETLVPPPPRKKIRKLGETPLDQLIATTPPWVLPTPEPEEE